MVLRERPELEKERVGLLESIATDSLTLRELEDRSLTSLSQSGSDGLNILDDAQLVDVLKQTKRTSGDIEARLERNEQTEKSLNVARQRFAPIATRATVLYFTVQNLSELNVMYQFSLAWFYAVFQSCLGADEKRHSVGSDDQSVAEEDDTIEPTLDRDLRKLAATSGGNRRASRLIVPQFITVNNNICAFSIYLSGIVSLLLFVLAISQRVRHTHKFYNPESHIHGVSSGLVGSICSTSAYLFILTVR